jgi:excisionase family DNA binding protein
VSAGGSNVLLTPDQAAERLAIPKRTLMDSYQRWKLRHVRVGKHIRFRERDVESWIDSQTVEP